KPASEHIGAAAREARRTRRLAELEALIRSGQDQLRTIAAELRALEDRRRTAQTEEAAAPRGDAVREALAREVVARRQLEAARSRAAQLELASSVAREKADAVAAKRDETARDLGLAVWVDRLDRLEDAITHYRDACVELW